MDSLPTKKDKLEQAKHEAEALRIKRHALYDIWSQTDSYKDLTEFMRRSHDSYINSAKKGVGVIDGQMTSLTKDQRMSLLDKADGFDIILSYIKNNLSNKPQ